MSVTLALVDSSFPSLPLDLIVSFLINSVLGMQRRVVRGNAQIASPDIQSPPRMIMSISNERTTRFNQRNLGVTNRIWGILVLVLVVVGFTSLVVPSHKSSQRYSYASELKPKNYLNSSGTNPFAFCPVFGPGDNIGQKLGALALSQSRVHLGSGGRVQRAIHKALLGQPVTISVLGGSVSACHGAGDDPISRDCYPSMFFDWWNTVFPHPASELTNGAMRRTDSAYFGYCSAHHLPDFTDLIILEFDIDDYATKSAVQDFEMLVRSLLIRPDQPAVIALGHFSPQIQDEYGFSGPDNWHNVVAQFYDVPHISIKPILYPQYMENPKSIEKYYVDKVLASGKGHGLLADTLISYIQSQICTTWGREAGENFESVQLMAGGSVADVAHGIFGGVGQRKGILPTEPHEDSASDGLKKVILGAHPVYQELRVPTTLIDTRPGDPPLVEMEPFCASANDLINPLPPSLFYGSGWNTQHPESGTSPLSSTGHYWYSTIPDSKLRIPITVSKGDIAIYYLKEPFGGNVGEGSSVECWVDDNYAGRKEIEGAGDVPHAKPTVFVIDHFVSKGSHFVECQLLGPEGVGVPAFKIIGILAT